MKRGEIYFANLYPTVGAEIRKKRPVLIVSNNANNKVSASITVVPITSNVEKKYTFEVFLPKKNSGLIKDSKAQCHQIRTLPKLRFNKKLAGKVEDDLMAMVEAAIKLHLAIK